MKFVFSKNLPVSERGLKDLVFNFHKTGEVLSSGRNQIKIFNLDDQKVNIKSFKIPNRINKIAYKFFRKSKAQRSFEYASKLLDKGIGTPLPLGYAEKSNSITFGSSYYLCSHLEYDLTYRDLTLEQEEILRSFTRFTFELHEKEIEFLDHSPGNTLINKVEGNYKFYLVDLNRMNFRELNFEERMLNFSRLTPKKEMVEVMADEYSKLMNKPRSEVFEKMWFYTSQFQEKFHRKKRLKKKLKFWKAN